MLIRYTAVELAGLPVKITPAPAIFLLVLLYNMIVAKYMMASSYPISESFHQRPSIRHNFRTDFCSYKVYRTSKSLFSHS